MPRSKKQRPESELDEFRAICDRALEQIPIREKRRKKQRKSLEFFARYYFPHFCKERFSRFHQFLFRSFREIISSSDPRFFAVAAPRGNA